MSKEDFCSICILDITASDGCQCS
uniref:Uncharacterized protein n=1 Tax=Anguilla anguilla TaxID=7936 RepID=A0A0E9TQW5_ANGAN